MEHIFNELNSHYKENDFESIFNHENGIYFLKMRSLSRVEILRRLAEKARIDIENIQGRQLFKYLFCKNVDIIIIDEFISEIYKEERATRRANEEDLYNQLYRLPVLFWDGFYQNAVEQTIMLK
ncbi:MAG: hypothetical protein ACE5GV_15480 [Candidatus Scalindua sp.]